MIGGFIMAKTKKHLTKSKDKVFLGVFGGIADYFGLDETLVRIIGILIFVFTGFFPLGVFYLFIIDIYHGQYGHQLGQFW